MDNEFEEELQQRLTRMESSGCGGMVQTNLPWKDFLIAVGALAVVSGLLLWWAV